MHTCTYIYICIYTHTHTSHSHMVLYLHKSYCYRLCLSRFYYYCNFLRLNRYAYSNHVADSYVKKNRNVSSISIFNLHTFVHIYVYLLERKRCFELPMSKNSYSVYGHFKITYTHPSYVLVCMSEKILYRFFFSLFFVSNNHYAIFPNILSA